jgi:hypothetical protein
MFLLFLNGQGVTCLENELNRGWLRGLFATSQSDDERSVTSGPNPQPIELSGYFLEEPGFAAVAQVERQARQLVGTAKVTRVDIVGNIADQRLPRL